jgi:hypothetical protein
MNNMRSEVIIVYAVVPTLRASHYLQALCKHFAHKVPARFDQSNGTVEFPFGLCLMTAELEQLSVRCEVATETDLPLIREVFDDHFARFAWREDVKPAWSRDGMPI